MIKALFFDIDGTLVSFKSHRIPESTIRGIEQAHKNGYKIFIATGRPYMIINNIPEIQGRGIIDGYITMNGAYCFTGDPSSKEKNQESLNQIKILHKGAISTSDIAAVADFCYQKQYPCIFVEENKMSVLQPNELVTNIFHDFLKVDYFPEVDYEEIKSKKIFQISPFVTQEQEELLMERLSGCVSGRWHPAFSDLTSKGNTKADGLKVIIKEFGLKRSELMTFGDGGNDIPMLLYAGLGVAMGQASENVKANANYVTSSVDEDGIYKALKNFNII